MDMKKLGEYGFIVGVLLALVAGLVIDVTPTVSTVLVLLGVLVGFVNIKEKESTAFLVATVALLSAGTAGLGSVDNLTAQFGVDLGQRIVVILGNIAAFVAPAAVIVSLKSIYSLSAKQ